MPPESLVHGPLMQTTASRKKKGWGCTVAQTSTFALGIEKAAVVLPPFFLLFHLNARNKTQL